MPEKSAISKETALELYFRMCETRKFEEEAEYLLTCGKYSGSCHPSTGQEASGVAAAYAMEQEDYKLYTHRGHACCIGTKGFRVKEMMAEMIGRSTGLSKGRGGSMHVCDPAIGILGTNGVVGGGIPASAGAGLSIRMKQEKKVVLCVFGDGATNQGDCHETMNLASAMKLPVIFYCENNRYGISTAIDKVTKVDDLSVRAQAYGMKGWSIDGNNAVEVYCTLRKAREEVMENGPVLIVANTCRWKGHNIHDKAMPYRPAGEVEELKKNCCPIAFLKKYILEHKLASEEEIDARQKKADAAIDEAVAFAEDSPAPSIENIYDFLYV